MWQIHSWDKKKKRGTVRAPHFGPLSFGPAENPKGTDDFVVGEEVVVSLAGDPSDYRVESVREVRPKPQPPATRCADFDVLRGSHDFYMVSAPSDPLVLWFGNCCSHCDPGALVSFVGATGWDEEADDDAVSFSTPLLRFASQEEIQRHKVSVPEGFVAYCIVDQPQRPWEDVCDPLFIVAKSASAELIRPARA